MSKKVLFKWNSFTGARHIALVSILAIAVAGCGINGFQPMYAKSPAGGIRLSEKMRALNVTTIPGRVGQRIRNELIFQSTGGGEKAASQYRLDITITERVTSTLVNIDGDSGSQIYQINASFRLFSLADNKLMLSGDSYGRAGFERYNSIFSNVRAQEDAENRAAITVAHDIKSRMEAFLARI